MLCDEKKYEVDKEKYTETIFSYTLYCGVKITKKTILLCYLYLYDDKYYYYCFINEL